MDFDFTTETITPDNTNVLTIGGTGGLELTVGTTVQRPGSPQNGIIRYNSDTGQLEAYYFSMWNSLLNSVAQQVIVQKTPGAGEFSSIAAAVASITDATVSNPYTVLVHPGVYTEPEISMKPYVNVAGVDEYSVMVQPLTATQHLFNMAGNSNLAFLRVRDTGPGYVAVNCEGANDDFMLLHKIGALDCATTFRVNASAASSTVYFEYCDASGGDIGLEVISENGFFAYANCENFYIFSSETTGLNHTIGVKIAGPGSDINIQTYGIEGATSTGTGFEISNGATVTIKAGRIFGWDAGIYVPNTGTGPAVTVHTTIFDNATLDIGVLNSGTTGELSASKASSPKVSVAAAPAFVLLYTDVTTGDYVQTGQFIYGSDVSTLTNITPLLLQAPTVGLLTGGNLSIGTGTDVSISAGSGYTSDGDTAKYITWTSGTITLSPGTSPYIYISSAGNILQSASVPPALTTIALGRALVGASSIITVGPTALRMRHYGNGVDTYLRTIFGPIFGSGCIVTENATARSVNVTAGSYFNSINNILPSAGTGITFLNLYQVAGVTTIASLTQVSNTQYLSGGNLVSLTTGYYAKHTLYSSGDGALQVWFMQHADAQYATLQEAIDAPLASPLIDPGGIPAIAAIIVGQGFTNIVNILDIRPRLNKTSSGAFGVTDHGELLGLDNDDHLQYLRVDGIRPMSGNLNLATNNIVNIGTANGVTIEAHASRHLPNGTDALTTAAAVTLTLSTANTAGIQNSLARSDHTHAITGAQPSSTTLTALAGYNTNGILTQASSDIFVGRAITGTTNRISITDGDGVAGNPTMDIASTYVGQTSLTTLGTITAGTWNATTIAATRGGTGQTVYAVGDILYASSTTALSKLANIAIGNALISGGAGVAPAYGKIGLTTHVSGVLPIASGGTGLAVTPANGQIDIGNGTGFTRTSLTAGAGINITPGAGSITIASTAAGTVTSVGVSVSGPVYSVSNTPVTTSGTIALSLLTQSANSVFAGPASGAAAVPTFRSVSLAQNDVSDVAITTPSNAQTLTYNSTTSKWINSTVAAASATATVGVSPTSGGTVWTLVSGTTYRADFVHNLGTTNVVITIFDVSNSAVVIANSLITLDANTVRLTVIGNTKTLKVVVIANGNSIAAGGSTPSSVIASYAGVTVTAAATKLNFTGTGVTVTDAGGGVSNIAISSPDPSALARFTYFATSLDTPVNSDYAVNSIAATVTDPVYASLNVRAFSNTIEQGVACMVSIPSGATTLTLKVRGRAQTAPGAASVVQQRLYYRLLPNNSVVGAWSIAQELANIAIPTNANFQYSVQTINLSTLGLTANNLYQFEITRRVTGVTGTNLAANFLMTELVVEFA